MIIQIVFFFRFTFLRLKKIQILNIRIISEKNNFQKREKKSREDGEMEFS